MSNQNTEHIVIKSEMPLGAQSNIRLILQDFFAGILCDRRARPEITAGLTSSGTTNPTLITILRRAFPAPRLIPTRP